PTWHSRGPTRYHTMWRQLRETAALRMIVEPEHALGGPSRPQQPYLFLETRAEKSSFRDPIAKYTWLLPRRSQCPALPRNVSYLHRARATRPGQWRPTESARLC